MAGALRPGHSAFQGYSAGMSNLASPQARGRSSHGSARCRRLRRARGRCRLVGYPGGSAAGAGRRPAGSGARSTTSSTGSRWHLATSSWPASPARAGRISTSTCSMPRPRRSCRMVGWSPSPWDRRASSPSRSPSRFGGTYYLDLNGASDAEGDYRLTVQTVPDPTPPTVSMVLAGGRHRDQPACGAGDPLGGRRPLGCHRHGVQPGRRDLDGLGAVPVARPPGPSRPGDGLRTLWAKVRNGAGLESAPTTATVTIDTVQPSIEGVIPAPGSTAVGLRPSFTVTFDEPMAPDTWSDYGLIVQAADGALVPGDYAYDDVRRTGAFVPSVALHPGATYIVTIGNVTDLAGNRPAPRGSWTVIPLAPTTLEARAIPALMTFGGGSRIELVLFGAPYPRPSPSRARGLLDHMDPAAAPGGRRREGDAERHARSDHRLSVHVRGRRRHRAGADGGWRPGPPGSGICPARAARAWGRPVSDGRSASRRLLAPRRPARPSRSASTATTRFGARGSMPAARAGARTPRVARRSRGRRPRPAPGTGARRSARRPTIWRTSAPSTAGP